MPYEPTGPDQPRPAPPPPDTPNTGRVHNFPETGPAAAAPASRRDRLRDAGFALVVVYAASELIRFFV